MNSGIRRFFSLAIVFAVAFAGVLALRVFSGGGSPRDMFYRLFHRGTPASGGQFRPEPFTLPEKPPLKTDDTEILARIDSELTKLTSAVVPSVISIDTVGMRTERLMDGWGRSAIRRYPTQGQGSGVIVTKEGHAITNHHVIAGQQQIEVTLHDGKTYPATLVGEDSLLDIAVLKIEGAENLQPLKFGDSSQVRVGQMVFAIGNPFGLGETVTKGIISAKERSLSDTRRDLFQTDAAINPGNSGGPLINTVGEIIGINAAIYSKDRENPGFQGVGFSIPSNNVRDAVTQILERGRPVLGYLGVQMHDLDPAIRSALRYDGPLGSVVMSPIAGSPAEAAGLQPWDIVLKYNGEPVKSTNQLISLVQRSKIGEPATFEVWRRGKTLNLKATIIESTAETQAAEAKEKPRGRTKDAEQVLEALGIVARDLTMQEILRGFRGALVVQVRPNALASGLLKPGDLIVKVNQTPINNANELYIHLAANAAVSSTAIQFFRDGRPATITLPALPRDE